jgi:endonuclease-3
MIQLTTKQRYASIRAVHAALRKRYRDFEHHNKRRVLDNLIFVICSVRTQEVNYVRAYNGLRRLYPKLATAENAPISRLARPLTCAGRQKQKAYAIREAIRLAIRTFGRASLEDLRRFNDDYCESFFRQIPWVGKKVARCVMMIPLNRAVFPVDTHVWRICRRLGWIKSESNRAFCSQAEMDDLQELVPKRLRMSLHVNMISLGREYCLPTIPRCSECPVARYCLYAQKRHK